MLETVVSNLASLSTAAMSAPDVVAGRRADRRVVPRAHRGRGNEVAGPGAGPGRPVLPPGAAVALRARPPLGRVRRVVFGGLVPGLRAWRVHDARDVAAAGQDVPDAAAEQAGGLVGRHPGHDVVVDGADDIGVLLRVRQRQGLAGELQPALGELVAA